MHAAYIALIVVLYFLILFAISFFVSKQSDQESFFTGNKKSPWFVVAYGMIGAALSGVTFVSLPGTVASNGLHFGQFILGNIFGYLFITYVLIPLYYKLNLVSIYTFLDKRFGFYAYKSGTFTFLLSQSFGAALRMLLAIKVFHVFFGIIAISLFGYEFVLQPKLWHLAVVFIALIYLYTYKSGIKTIVWTDMLQTTFLLGAAILIAYLAMNKMGLSLTEILQKASELTFTSQYDLNGKMVEEQLSYTHFFDWNWQRGSNFFKQFISGALIAVAMMGLDQNMMQKSLTIKNVKDAQKNTLMFSLSVGIVQILFLIFGMILFVYANQNGIDLPKTTDGTIMSDQVLPFLVKNEFGTLALVMFILGITAAAFSSIDSALAALTTSYCYDFLKKDKKEPIQPRLKNTVHVHFALFLLLIIVIFSSSEGNIFSTIFSIASYTYAPLLGIYLLGIFTNIKVRDWSVPIAFFLSPIVTFVIDSNYDLSFFKIFVGAVVTVSILLIYKLVPFNFKANSQSNQTD